MDNQERKILSEKIIHVIQDLQTGSDPWVDFARVGSPLVAADVQYKQYGFPKLRLFLNEFQDILEFKDECPVEGNPPISYVRLRFPEDSSIPPLSCSPVFLNINPTQSEKYPSQDSWLFNWATIPKPKIKELSELALEERWYYGDTLTPEQENLPILRNYLAYTFKRLCFENKILIRTEPKHNKDYAAFNTGLVDKKYEYIYALFKHNTQYPNFYWYLYDFVVAGEDRGKDLVAVFNPLPKRADYFENKIQNMLYDTSTGDLSCDFIHIITERTDRLPADFLTENLPLDFLCIDGVSVNDVCHNSSNEEKRLEYYRSLGDKIKNNSKMLNRLKNRVEDAVNLALKRVEWNYKTAIPMYYPTQNTGSLLLPLSLVEEDRVDLALVVERLSSGAYQGQTILPLNWAYSNSRLVTRPDSDWLKTDAIDTIDSDDDE